MKRSLSAYSGFVFEVITLNKTSLSVAHRFNRRDALLEGEAPECRPVIAVGGAVP
jgi:hypothetical protein